MKRIKITLVLFALGHYAFAQKHNLKPADSLAKSHIFYHTEFIRKRILNGDTSLVSDHLKTYVKSMEHWYMKVDIPDSLKYHPTIKKIWQSYGEIIYITMLQSETNSIGQQKIYQAFLWNIDSDCNDLIYNASIGWYSNEFLIGEAENILHFLEIQKEMLRGNLFYRNITSKTK